MSVIRIDQLPSLSGSSITRLAFRYRFTFAERVALESAADTDPTVRALLKDFDASSFIDLSSQATADGLAILAGNGLLSAERVEQILTAPVHALEVP